MFFHHCLYYMWTMSFVVDAYFHTPNVEPGYYANVQDITIGILGFVHTRDQNGMCGHNTSFLDLILSPQTIQQPEAVYFAVNEINRRSDILPNVSLGFVFLDGCYGDLTSLARSVYFIPKYHNGVTVNPNKTENSYNYLDVDCIIIHAPSRITTLVASLTSAFSIPSLGTIATSDELSDKEQYPFFSRISPPDNLQTKAIVDIIKRMNWNYISFIYTAGSYGQNAARYFNLWIRETEGICIAFNYILPYEGTTVEREVTYAIDQLVKYNAKVVVIILEITVLSRFLHEVDDRGLTGNFIWLGSDALDGIQHTKLAHLVAGTIHTSLQGDSKINGTYVSFNEYFNSLSPWNATSNNPWIFASWEWTFKCTWNKQSERDNRTSCFNYKGFGDGTNVQISSLDSMLIDAVYVYAQAFDKLLSENCPDAYKNRTLIKTCIKHDLVISTLRSLKLKSLRRPIEFDIKGDLIGGYHIKQIQMTNDGKYIAKDIGRWDVKSENVSIVTSALKWYLKGERSDTNGKVPEFRCSKPCGKGMVKLKQKLPCCWLCHECYEYEYLADNGTFCKSCPLYMWPEANTRSFCIDITPNYLKLQHPAAAAVLAATLLGIVLWIGICQQAIYHRRHKLIMACDREQSWCQLCGILLALVTSMLYLTKPTDLNCSVRKIGFNIPVTILYGSLLIKTIQMYRILNLGRQGIKSPSFISRKFQRLFLAGFCIIQVVVIAIAEVLSPSVAELRMPFHHEKYVELVCASELWAFLTPLCYNITLIFLCAYFGLLTRKYPVNYNEAWYIFVSVATTLFAWVILLPTYFNIFYRYHQEALLALCLIITSYILLFCLYFPKIYAIIFVKDTGKLHIKKR